MTKYALIGLLSVCATVLCFSLIFRERLCELNIHRGNTVVQVTLAYEGVRLENGKYPTLSLFFVQTAVY
ncbi:type I toxin-antitoxin system Hok family toxin [Salmonella enterica]|nr:type I toxin-antitoxin system Hok family toxin [Salmonella enterica]